jgi:hypothetical protein
MTQTPNQTGCGAAQLAAMLVGFMVGPVATPALIWFALAADLPLALIILLLITMVVVSNGLSHIIIRIKNLAEAGASGHAMGNAQAY